MGKAAAGAAAAKEEEGTRVRAQEAEAAQMGLAKPRRGQDLEEERVDPPASTAPLLMPPQRRPSPRKTCKDNSPNSNSNSDNNSWRLRRPRWGASTTSRTC